MERFDVIFKGPSVSIDYHFCRDIDCFGTDETHGNSFDEAKEAVISHLKRELETWRGMSYEEWKRTNYPTEKEMDEDMDRAESLYDLVEEYK